MENISQKKVKDPAPLIAPFKMNLWLFMLASSMLFAAFVSAYIVARPDAEAKHAEWGGADRLAAMAPGGGPPGHIVAAGGEEAGQRPGSLRGQVFARDVVEWVDDPDGKGVVHGLRLAHAGTLAGRVDETQSPACRPQLPRVRGPDALATTGTVGRQDRCDRPHGPGVPHRVVECVCSNRTAVNIRPRSSVDRAMVS